MPKTYAKTHSNTIPYKLRKPDGLGMARIRAVYPLTGEMRIAILNGTLTGHRHSLKIVRCKCGQPLLGRWQKRKVRGYPVLPTAKVYHGDTPSCEACAAKRNDHGTFVQCEPSRY